MLGWFRALMPREDRFFDLFANHARTVVGGAEALNKLLQGGEAVERHCREIVELEHEADGITQEVMNAVRKSFITPFDRSDIKDLIQSMDDAIDMMHKTVKTVTLYEQRTFDPKMQEMGALIVEAAHLIQEAIPLLQKPAANLSRLSAIVEETVKLEGRSDDLHDRGLRDLYQRHGKDDAMAFLIGSEIYGELEKVVDRFEDVANEISGILIENL
jgi:predicted phosphate transport protein (TIGR00153 family)